MSPSATATRATASTSTAGAPRAPASSGAARSPRSRPGDVLRGRPARARPRRRRAPRRGPARADEDDRAEQRVAAGRRRSGRDPARPSARRRPRRAASPPAAGQARGRGLGVVGGRDAEHHAARHRSCAAASGLTSLSTSRPPSARAAGGSASAGLAARPPSARAMPQAATSARRLDVARPRPRPRRAAPRRRGRRRGATRARQAREGRDGRVQPRVDGHAGGAQGRDARHGAVQVHRVHEQRLAGGRSGARQALAGRRPPQGPRAWVVVPVAAEVAGQQQRLDRRGRPAAPRRCGRRSARRARRRRPGRAGCRAMPVGISRARGWRPSPRDGARQLQPGVDQQVGRDRRLPPPSDMTATRRPPTAAGVHERRGRVGQLAHRAHEPRAGVAQRGLEHAPGRGQRARVRGRGAAPACRAAGGEHEHRLARGTGAPRRSAAALAQCPRRSSRRRGRARAPRSMASTSATLTSLALPSEASRLKPSPCFCSRPPSSMARLPLWATKATGPGASVMPMRVQASRPPRRRPCSSARPAARPPAARARTSRRCASRPRSPVSAKPAATATKARDAGRETLLDGAFGRARRDREHREVAAGRHVAQARVHGTAVDLAAAPVDEVQVEARLGLRQRLHEPGAPGHRVRARADDGDAAWLEQGSQVAVAGRHAGRTLAGAGASIASTPRRSSPRATIRRWISLVPSQMRSTRSSRRKRSATLVRT